MKKKSNAETTSTAAMGCKLMENNLQETTGIYGHIMR